MFLVSPSVPECEPLIVERILSSRYTGVLILGLEYATDQHTRSRRINNILEGDCDDTLKKNDPPSAVH